jgi:hypothetical protein
MACASNASEVTIMYREPDLDTFECDNCGRTHCQSPMVFYLYPLSPKYLCFQRRVLRFTPSAMPLRCDALMI